METIELKERQKQAIELCKKNKRFGVFFDMGGGKTATMLSLVNDLVFETQECKSVLIIAPPNIITKGRVWQNEIAKWENFKHMDCIEMTGKPSARVAKKGVASITLLSDSLIQWYYDTFKHMHDYDIIIVDESSRFKSPTAQRSKLLRKMVDYSKRIYLLSGTPCPNSVEDLWAQVYLIDKGETLGKFITYFRMRFGFPNAFGYGYTYTKNTNELVNKLIKPYCIFAKADDVELPKCTEHFEYLDFDDKMMKRYKDFVHNYVINLEDGQEVSTFRVADVLNKAMQITNGCIYTNANDEVQRYEELNNVKLDWLKAFASKQQDNILVFYTYKFDRERILKHIDGAEELKTAEDIARWNNGEIKVAIASPYSLGHGVNLQQGGHIVVWYGLIWNLELYLQANKRVYRLGQKHDVDIYYLLINKTVDNRVLRRLQDKNQTEQEFLESIKLDLYNI